MKIDLTEDELIWLNMRREAEKRKAYYDALLGRDYGKSDNNCDLAYEQVERDSNRDNLMLDYGNDETK